MQFDIFSEIWQPFANQEELLAYLQQACARYSVLNLSYWFFGVSSAAADKPTWLSTYDEDYMTIYKRDFAPPRDPAFRTCFATLMPLDWGSIRNDSDLTREIHHVAEQFGVGRQGISYPIRDLGSGVAMFSINFDCDDRHWVPVRNHLVNGFHLFAHYFHLRVSDVAGARHMMTDHDLSPREREVLKWAAVGKTAWETAQVLGVGERAVRLYTEKVTKLGAKTKTQAVATAIKRQSSIDGLSYCTDCTPTSIGLPLWLQWMPHSVLPVPAQRPARGSSAVPPCTVQGSQPIEK